MKIVVLAGGLSTEREISLGSGTQICNTLRELGHEAILVDSYLGISNAPEDLSSLFQMDGTLLPIPTLSNVAPDLAAVKASRTEDTSDRYFGPHVIELCQMADICYLGLHGSEGENGQIQAALDLLGIKYTGAGYLGSAVAMHKLYTKNVFHNYGIPTPKGFLALKDQLGVPLSEHGFTFPVVVKPCSGGSSVGVFIPQNEEEYQEALAENFRMGEEVLVEEYIKGREFGVGILAGKPLPVVEIVPKDGWFDYEHKYQSGYTDEICPAPIDDTTAKRMQEYAVTAAKALSLDVYSRMDFLLTEKGDLYCLECNSLPGMTPASLLPKEAAAAGISYPELCERIIRESFRKYETK